MLSRTIVACLFAALSWSGIVPMSASGQTEPSDETVQQERSFFDFLIGEWGIAQREGPNGRVQGGDDTYTFRRVLDGSGILSEWYFNRGTPNEPTYTHGMYMSAFDEMTGTWSFYYISPQNAMYYQGQKEGGQWYFYKRFDIDGHAFLQRQSWEPLDATTVLRRIENSEDDGATWETVYLVTLTRTE